MKLLSEQQIKICESAQTGRCRCRCRGTLHGIRIGAYRQLVLIADDENPHKLRGPLGFRTEVPKAWSDEP